MEEQYLREKGLRLYTAGDFFEAHEVWEEIWKQKAGASAEFYKGLIQAAVALAHSQNGNTKGALKLTKRAESRLLQYSPTHLGINVQQILDDLTMIDAV
ncbi:MAG: DUF309 domain-containing protein [Planctomycetes bacterium]|jgi:hypothetical protein|nr:DUF309 domain-containing protein [Planctomycetota bacterium]MBT4027994.1 DUF309 domain-containing protein [Planctomycetota bacterium]MBT4561116.1 DUF309 domain-containing protein [Planctomycetota bacterium]MBT5101430.1 DUF309 domain-containing protein [Planctomycetota bacterium]MBT5120829.1 DUF309 domain-containing protein [Planctomycetota bacterium]